MVIDTGIKIFMSVLAKDMIHVWHGDRYWSKILGSTIPIPVYDLKVKVTNFMQTL